MLYLQSRKITQFLNNLKFENMKKIFIVIIFLAFLTAGCSFFKPVTTFQDDEFEKFDTIYQTKQGGCWVVGFDTVYKEK